MALRMTSRITPPCIRRGQSAGSTTLARATRSDRPLIDSPKLSIGPFGGRFFWWAANGPCGAWRACAPDRRLLFVHARAPGLGQLLLLARRHRVVVTELHGVGALAAGEGLEP